MGTSFAIERVNVSGKRASPEGDARDSLGGTDLHGGQGMIENTQFINGTAKTQVPRQGSQFQGGTRGRRDRCIGTQNTVHIDFNPSGLLHQAQVMPSPGPGWLTGSTHLVGSAALPHGSLQARALHGLLEAAEPVVHGRILSAAPLPVIKPMFALEALERIDQATSIQVGLGRPAEDAVWHLAGKTHKFDGDLTIPPRISTIQGPGTILVKGSIKRHGALHIDGAAVMVAGKDISLQAPLEMTGTLVAGQKLNLELGVRGLGVLVACEMIRIMGPDLEQPSILGLIERPGSSNKNRRRLIMDRGRFSGTLVAWSERGNDNAVVDLGTNLTIEGYVHVMGMTHPGATIRGYLGTTIVQGRAGAQIFENWLPNLRIDRAPEQIDWALPAGFSQRTEILAMVRR